MITFRELYNSVGEYLRNNNIVLNDGSIVRYYDIDNIEILINNKTYYMHYSSMQHNGNYSELQNYAIELISFVRNKKIERFLQ